MAAITELQLSQFALDVAEGLSESEQKKISPRYFYDDLGSVLFDAITLLPEYGLTRAEERLLTRHASDILSTTGPVEAVAELGSGSGVKTQRILKAALDYGKRPLYYPIDVSTGALAACERQNSSITSIMPICGDWMAGLAEVSRLRTRREPLLLLFLGSSIGNLLRAELTDFVQALRSYLRPGDFLLLGVDLVKEVHRMLSAYDDPTGVTAAFNLNLLGRIQRELNADIDLRAFAHEVRWHEQERRIEMHLRSLCKQCVRVPMLETVFYFREGETIWTESSHKFAEDELSTLASANDFSPTSIWIDTEWPFAEALWQAV